jgi:hypothetical protein
MSLEQFANEYSTTLQGSITAGATSLVVSSATGAPGVPFRLKIDDEILLVTAVAGTTYTVTRGQEGTPAASHADGAAVEHILTAGGLATFAKGLLGFASVTADQTGITTTVDLTGLSVTVTVPAGRRIRVTGVAQFLSTVAGDIVLLAINEPGVSERQHANRRLGTASVLESVVASVVLSPSAGSHTYTLTGRRFSGTGTLTMGAAAHRPAQIVVEDIGAA